MIQYVFRDPCTIKGAARANPQRIGEELARITAANGGTLTPEATVEAARPARHVLHRHFTWDDQKAAEERRLHQARTLIRSIRVIEDNDPTPRYAFLSIVEPRLGRRYYEKSAVCDSLQLQLRVLLQAERDLEAWEKRYAELQDICQTIRAIRNTLRSRRRRLDDDHDGDEARPH
jgi:hypothetical protein